MKTEAELNSAILKITMKIEHEFPELSKYIPEMPVKVSFPIAPVDKIKDLTGYHQSLLSLLKNYSTGHIANTNSIL